MTTTEVSYAGAPGMRVLALLPLLLVAAFLLGCSGVLMPGGAQTSFVDYRRTGGIAGVDDHLVIQKGGEAKLARRSGEYEFTLDEARLESLRMLFEYVDFTNLRGEYLPPGQGADRFEYVVTYEGHTVRAMDGAVPTMTVIS